MLRALVLVLATATFAFGQNTQERPTSYQGPIPETEDPEPPDEVVVSDGALVSKDYVLESGNIPVVVLAEDVRRTWSSVANVSGTDRPIACATGLADPTHATLTTLYSPGGISWSNDEARSAVICSSPRGGTVRAYSQSVASMLPAYTDDENVLDADIGVLVPTPTPSPTPAIVQITPVGGWRPLDPEYVPTPTPDPFATPAGTPTPYLPPVFEPSNPEA